MTEDNIMIDYNYDTGAIEEYKISDVSHVAVRNIKGHVVPVYTTIKGYRYSPVATLEEMDGYLTKERGFVQADNELVINLKQVKRIDEKNGKVVFKDGETYTVARTKIQEIKEKLEAYGGLTE